MLSSSHLVLVATVVAVSTVSAAYHESPLHVSTAPRLTDCFTLGGRFADGKPAGRFMVTDRDLSDNYPTLYNHSSGGTPLSIDAASGDLIAYDDWVFLNGYIATASYFFNNVLVMRFEPPDRASGIPLKCHLSPIGGYLACAVPGQPDLRVIGFCRQDPDDDNPENAYFIIGNSPPPPVEWYCETVNLKATADAGCLDSPFTIPPSKPTTTSKLSQTAKTTSNVKTTVTSKSSPTTKATSKATTVTSKSSQTTKTTTPTSKPTTTPKPTTPTSKSSQTAKATISTSKTIPTSKSTTVTSKSSQTTKVTSSTSKTSTITTLPTSTAGPQQEFVCPSGSPTLCADGFLVKCSDQAINSGVKWYVYSNTISELQCHQACVLNPTCTGYYSYEEEIDLTLCQHTNDTFSPSTQFRFQYYFYVTGVRGFCK
ncbi:hypothetical protein BJ166DRAFT_593507 [Pestalotiopsis sp. NC0098]|nr:hypothetical protein BJ166DRAFT_593507 [Pestalotiopsis sp. NC0098]